MASIIDTLNEIKQIYSTRGFRIENIHKENEFNMIEIKNSQLPALFHIYGKDEHAGLIERSNRIVKNRTRTMTQTTPYKSIPKVLVIALVMNAVKLINVFPNKTEISRTMSSSTIVLGLQKPNIKFNRIMFGLHVMVYAGTKNKMNARSVPAIVLNSSNKHGGYYFMSLYSGKRMRN